MSKKFRSQASSARVASTLTGGFGSFQTSSSPLSYVTEQPDLLQISEPNVVVAFKNLGKKDSTTKAKALEELQEFISGNVEDAVLVAWSDIYPRTSIDNSRRVRQLAHTIQGNLVSSTGKRIVRLLPKLVGSWLAGTYDNDQSVSRTARDALEKSFPTLEKRRALWTIYKDSIFEYVEDAITVQTKGTLSDERTTSPDDAETKYVRVVGTAMNMLGQMLRDGNGTELLGKKLWEFVYHSDPYLRRGACGLVIAAVGEQLDWSAVSTCFLSKGLHANQLGSSRQFTEALLELTKRRPQLWTSDYSGKTSASKRLHQFLRQGSQSGPEDVWSKIAALLMVIPEEVWHVKEEDVIALADSMRSGVTSERINTVAAWKTYVQTILWLSTKMNEKLGFFEQQLIPLIDQYVSGNGEWISNARIAHIATSGIMKQDQPTFERLWNGLVDQVIDQMKLSLPETSKDFVKSQDNVIGQVKRLLALKGETSTTGEQPLLQESDKKLLAAASDLLKSRNGKPYGAAGAIESLVRQPNFDKQDLTLQNFLKDEVPRMLNGPSAAKLIAISMLCGRQKDVELLLLQQSQYSQSAMSQYIQMTMSSSGAFDNKVLLSIKEINDNTANLCISILSNSALKQLQEEVLAYLQELLSSPTPLPAIQLLEQLLSDPTVMKTIVSSSQRSSILSQLLILSDSEATNTDQISSIIAKLNSNTNGLGSIPIIQEQFSAKGTPLSIFTLIDLANAVADDNKAILDDIIPSIEQWTDALAPHISSPIPYSLSVCSRLQGVVYTLEPNEKQFQASFDIDSFSTAFRLARYVTKLNLDVTKLSQPAFEALQQMLPIALQLINEKLTLENANEIWLQSTSEVIQEAVEVLADGNKLLISWLDNKHFVDHWLPEAHNLTGNSFDTYYSGLAWVNTAAEYVDRHGPAGLLQEYDKELKSLHRSANIIQSAALLAVLGDQITTSTHGKRLCNELAAGATDGNDTAIVLLNILLRDCPDALDTIPTQRIVFLLKGIVGELGSATILSEHLRLTTAILPLVSDIYGEHWEQILFFVKDLWANPDLDLSTLNTSLRLYSMFERLVRSDEVNEDMRDAYLAAKADLDNGLLNQLQTFGRFTQDIDQPRNITSELLRRHLVNVDAKSDINLFALLSSKVEAVQTAAYQILDREIPKQQEQLSLDLVLEQRTVNLPADLLALLVNTSESRQYLLAWKLVFDHFSTASFKLRELYAAEIKRAGHLDGFLSFTCDVLRMTGRPVDASKFDIQQFSVESDDQTHWLTIHNYYNSLLYLPSLSKDWFISQKNRVKGPLESWTQKYISPLIIAASLSAVNDWSRSQEDDDRSLAIKSSPRGSELVASITIDPENPPIALAVSLPGSYPLESPAVNSRTRVGVSEKNWQSWLRTIQIIIFSTGSIIEGLVAFRRNVQGALKGQSECAICYSIIGTDMQTPNKKCGTCKNTFHGSCLFRWFKSSNSSSCPLCRNNFNYA